MSQSTINKDLISLNPQKQFPISRGETFQRQNSLRQSDIRSIHTSHQSIERLILFFKHYKSNPDYIDMQKINSSAHLKLKKYKESLYYGEFINGKRHGQGVMIYYNSNESIYSKTQNNNTSQQPYKILKQLEQQYESNLIKHRKYEGQWQNDFKHGKGIQFFANGCIYQGFYINGKPEGIGRYSWPNGEFYEGEWLNGMKHGSGMWKGVKGDSYVGEWKFGKADGCGVHSWINGDRYEGEFKESLKHGEGLQRFVNGDMYKGFYSYGKPSGFGQYYWTNGSYFKGTFKNGLRNGQGIWKKGTGNSDKYEGQYVNDRKSGYGIFTWASGNIYKGNYENDSRNGHGQMYWTDGSFYKGDWLNGIQHGFGCIYIPGEGVKKGVFQNNTLIKLEQQYNDYNQMLSQQTTNSKSLNRETNKYAGRRLIEANANKTRQSFRTRAYSTNNKNQKKYIKTAVKSRQTNVSNQQKISNEARVFKLSSLKANRTGNVLMGTKQTGNNLRSLTPHANRVIRFGGMVNGRNEKVSNDKQQKNKKERIMHSAFYMHKFNRQQQVVNE